MGEQLRNQLRSVLLRFQHLSVYSEFREKVQSYESLTKKANSQSHFVVYFAVYDKAKQMVLMGLHIKAAKWLFTGGHLEDGETLHAGVIREGLEELGILWTKDEIGDPVHLTISEISNPNYECQTHYEVWFFINVDSQTFSPKYENWSTEFHKIRWLSIADLWERVPELISEDSIWEALAILKNLCEVQ